MARFNLKVTGSDKVLRMFQQAPEVMTKEASKIIYETAVEIENRAKARVAVDTGALRQSIRATKLSDGSAMVKAGLPNVSNAKGHRINYAAYVEFGTGQGYRTPSYKNLDNAELDTYASEFIGLGIRRVDRLPGPYLFNSASELIGKMVNRIKNIKI